MSPHLPITPERSPKARSARRKAGAAIVHLHAREPDDGRPTQDPEMFMRFLPKIKAAADVVINLTTGGAPTMTIEERLQPALQAQARGRLAQHGLDELRPVRDDPRATRSGSTTGRSPTSPAATSASSRTRSRTSPTSCRSCSGNDTRFEIECYDIGHLLHRRAFPRSRAGQAAAVHPVGVRHPRRHRPAPRGRDAHEAHRRPPVRRRSTSGRCSAPGATRCTSPRSRR